MKKFYSILFLMLSICTTTYADNWMQYLPDNAYVVDVSIPGSHDAGTGNGWPTVSMGKQFSTTQDITLEEQWKLGARAFDLRPKVNGNRLAVNHGATQTNLYFDDAIKQLCNFLKENPSEFIIVHLLYATGFDNDKDKYKTMLLELLNSDDVKDYLINFRKDLTVKDMRGKILLISRDPYDSTPVGGFFNGWGDGIYWNLSISGPNSTATLNVQDLSHTYDAKDEKDNAIRALLNFSTKNVATDADKIVWSFNLASAWCDQSVSTSNGYRENATYTHPTFIDYLKENPAGPTGIVLMDYLGVDTSKGYLSTKNYNTRGQELLDTIINNNWRYLPKINDEGKTISAPYYTYTTTGWTCTTGNTFHVNTWSTEGITDGSGMVTPFFEDWLNKGGRLGNGEIYYTLSECKKGYYKVSIKTRLLNEAGGTDISGASMFANEGSMEITTGIPCTNGYFSNYSVIGKVNEESGELKFGFKIDNANFNWISFTYVDVEYLGDDEVTVADAGDLMLDAKYEKILKEAYKQAQAAFEADPSMETYNALSKAYRDAEPSIEAYKELAKALEYADNVYSEASAEATEESKEEYLSIISKIKELYDAEVYNDSEIKASIIPQIYAALAALKKSLGEGMDMTSLIVNNSFETGDMTGWSLPKGSSDDTGVRQPVGDYAAEGCDGNYMFNTWWQGVPVTQTITGLPNGRYRLNALVSSDGATVYLTANGGHNEGTETGGSYPGKDKFQEASYEFDVTEGYATIGAIGGANGTAGVHKPYIEDGYWWYKADNFRLTYIDAYLSYMAKPFSGDGDLEAGQWYVYNVGIADDYIFSTIEDIETTTKDALLGDISPVALPDTIVELSAGVLYFKSATAQHLTITKVVSTDDITVPEAEYIAYITKFNTDFTKTKGVTAYKVTEATATSVALEEITAAPEGTAVILNGKKGNYTINRTKNDVSSIEDNLFLPGGDKTGNGISIYTFGYTDGIGFYLVDNGIDIPADNGYIVIENDDPDAEIKNFIPLFEEDDEDENNKDDEGDENGDDDDEDNEGDGNDGNDEGDGNGEEDDNVTTAIETLNAEDINETAVIYNTSGQRVATPTSGIYIVNGKKVVIKK